MSASHLKLGVCVREKGQGGMNVGSLQWIQQKRRAEAIHFVISGRKYNQRFILHVMRARNNAGPAVGQVKPVAR